MREEILNRLNEAFSLALTRCQTKYDADLQPNTETVDLVRYLFCSGCREPHTAFLLAKTDQGIASLLLTDACTCLYELTPQR
jgi:hypothetical protein